MSSSKNETLYLFTIGSEYCDTNIQLDSEERLVSYGNSDDVVIGIYRGNYRDAKDQAIDDLLDRFGIDKPQEVSDDTDNDEGWQKRWNAYEEKRDIIDGALMRYELVSGGDHSSLILL